MMAIVTHLIALALGCLIAWTAARYRIRQIQRDDLSFRMAPTIPHSIEDAARRAGV